MNVYVETNFVLELALLHEQHLECQDLVDAAKDGRIRLFVPGFALVEPYQTLVRRRHAREDLSNRLQLELRQLARSATYRTRATEVSNQSLVLVESTQPGGKFALSGL